MTQRITNQMLDRLCDRLNQVTGSPTTSWTRDADGNLKANVGNYHISGAYGGVTLHRTMNDGGGVETPLSCGYVSKRELFNRLHAYLDGMRDATR